MHDALAGKGNCASRLYAHHSFLIVSHIILLYKLSYQYKCLHMSQFLLKSIDVFVVFTDIEYCCAELGLTLEILFHI